jgi:hypothetical protein
MNDTIKTSKKVKFINSIDEKKETIIVKNQDSKQLEIQFFSQEGGIYKVFQKPFDKLDTAFDDDGIVPKIRSDYE